MYERPSYNLPSADPQKVAAPNDGMTTIYLYNPNPQLPPNLQQQPAAASPTDQQGSLAAPQYPAPAKRQPTLEEAMRMYGALKDKASRRTLSRNDQIRMQKLKNFIEIPTVATRAQSSIAPQHTTRIQPQKNKEELEKESYILYNEFFKVFTNPALDEARKKAQANALLIANTEHLINNFCFYFNPDIPDIKDLEFIESIKPNRFDLLTFTHLFAQYDFSEGIELILKSRPHGRYLRSDPLYDYDSNCYTLIHAAAQYGSEKSMEVVLGELIQDSRETQKKAAHINKATISGKFSAIHFAAKHGSAVNVQALIDAGANINQQDFYGNTALHYAVRIGNVNNINALISAGANINQQDFYGNTALHHAVINSPNHVVQALIDAGANINQQDSYGNTALHHAVRIGNVNNINALISAGAKLNIQNNKGNTPFHVAIIDGNIEALEAFISAGVDVNELNGKGYHPFHLAALAGNDAVMNILSSSGCVIDQENERWRNALTEAIENGEIEEVINLIKAGADVNATNTHGHYPIEIAIRFNQKEIFNLLINNLASVKISVPFYGSLLEFALINSDEHFVKKLIDKGCDINEKDENGNTVLHRITKSIYEKPIRNAIRFGADVNAKNNADETPLEVLIKDFQNNIGTTIPSRRGYGACHSDILNDNKRDMYKCAIKLLVENGADFPKGADFPEVHLNHQITHYFGKEFLEYIKESAEKSAGRGTLMRKSGQQPAESTPPPATGQGKSTGNAYDAFWAAAEEDQMNDGFSFATLAEAAAAAKAAEEDLMETDDLCFGKQPQPQPPQTTISETLAVSATDVGTPRDGNSATSPKKRTNSSTSEPPAPKHFRSGSPLSSVTEQNAKGNSGHTGSYRCV